MAAPLLGPPGLTGRTLGHYRVDEKIGAGGMGEVYRGRDLHLDRDVALKVLPTGLLADESARKRFRKEALALSKLNHPGIETVHDFDTQEGVDFLVMEYVPGVTLSERLAAGPLPEAEVERLGLQLAEAVEAAHERGVVHRDLKPGNLRLTPEGRLKVLDFGLAKLLQPAQPLAATESLSQTGGPVGTLPYMAPEQLQGRPADPRTDIYAVGVVLYEMATGRLPFAEKLSTALVDDILHRPPPPPGRLQPSLSPRLEDIVLKCLEKDPANRYQSVKELQVDLRRLSAPPSLPQAAPPRPRLSGRVWIAAAGVGMLLIGALLVAFDVGGLRSRLRPQPAAPRIQSLAVLPLTNLSRDPEQEYFADGMTEALITDLSKLSTLKVISRTSVMRYKGSNKPLPEIARELNVDGIIEGSVLRSGGRVRITAQLIHAPSDTHVWAESYERDLRDVLALQDEVAAAITHEVRVQVAPSAAAAHSSQPLDLACYEAYLKGRFYIGRMTREDGWKAVQSFQQAIQISPAYAPAYAGLADAYFKLGQPLGAPTPAEARDLFAKSREAARKAVELDDSLSEAHVWLGQSTLFLEWDWAAAEREMQRALELDPNSADALRAYSVILTLTGRHLEARQHLRRALELDPVSVMTRSLAAELIYRGRPSDETEAEKEARKAIDLNPDSRHAHLVLAWIYQRRGQGAEAAVEYARAGILNADQATALERAFRTGGMRAFCFWWIQALRTDPALKSARATHFAVFYALAGDREQAFQYLEKAYREHDSNLLFLKAGPEWDSLRSDPRFVELERRVGLPPSPP